MTGLADLPGSQFLTIDVAGQATAGTVDEFAGIVVPFNCTVVSARYTPKSVLTGAATNFCTVTVRNRGQAAAGATVPASKAFSNGVNAPAFTATTLTLSATAADLLLTAGDVLTVEKLVSGTGLAMPAGQVRVEVTVR